MFSTQLTDFHHLDVEDVSFQTIDKGNGVQRVRILTHHADGTRGDLIVSTPRLVSFGLQEIHNNNKDVVGYQLPFVLWGKNGPNTEEKLFLDKLNEVSDRIKDYLLSQTDLFPNLKEEDLDRVDPLYYKVERGENVPNRAPLLYTRLNSHKQGDNNIVIHSLFIDDVTKEKIDALSTLNKRCIVQGAIKIESVILTPNSRPRLQVKLFEVRVRPLNTGFKSLLEPGKVFPKSRREKN